MNKINDWRDIYNVEKDVLGRLTHRPMKMASRGLTDRSCFDLNFFRLLSLLLLIQILQNGEYRYCWCWLGWV